MDRPRMPVLQTRAYVANSNESYWLSNPEQPLTGFPRLFGDEGAARSMRTRDTLSEIRAALAAGKLTTGSVRDLVLSNRSYAADLALADVLGLCRTLGVTPVAASAGQAIDVSPACRALAGWDGRTNVESRGALLFDRFWQRLVDLAGDVNAPALWQAAFDPKDPVNTPRGLRASEPIVSRALADAQLEVAPLGLDAPLGQVQWVQIGPRRVGVGGGSRLMGVFNRHDGVWDPKAGYAGLVNASGYLHVVGFADAGKPEAYALLAYGQSADPLSPFYYDQLDAYVAKAWPRIPFTDAEIAAEQVKVIRVGD
jgi:acyl-homoserine-lactone acylase